ncbi:16438_t:CDS:1, partial [Acaulospora colombiana]
MRLCWNADDSERPTAKQMHENLEELWNIIMDNLINSTKSREKLREFCKYSSLEEFDEDLEEFRNKYYSVQKKDNQIKVHPKANYTSQSISDLTKNIHWNKSTR